MGATGTLEEYEELVNRPEAPKGTLLFLEKYRVQRLFSHYGRAVPIFNELPPHARIGLDTQGLSEIPGNMVWWLLEAKLFEDMALLWNALDDAGQEPLSKLGEALVRATARSAFHFVEGYLNGIAEDVLNSPDVATLSSKEKAMLREWDEPRNRPKHLSLRDKILQYPRIALRAPEPVLSEDSSTSMCLITRRVFQVRNPLVHPNPREVSPGNIPGEAPFFWLRRTDVAHLVDASVSLVREIAAKIGGRSGQVDRWLFGRDARGRFPDKAFF